jgi:hypothetical protein
MRDGCREEYECTAVSVRAGSRKSCTLVPRVYDVSLKQANVTSTVGMLRRDVA